MLPLFCDAPLAARAHCAPTQGAPLVTADLRQPPVAYRASTGSALRAQAQANGTPLGRGGGILGLTVNRYDVGMHVAVAATRDGGEYCATLRSASIAFAAEPQVLFDERFAPDSCQRTAILAHESEHVAVFRDAIAAAAPEIEAALHGAALPPAIRAASPSDAEEAYARAIRAALDPVLAAIRERTAAANAAIDTPAHYAEVFSRCAAW